MCVCVSIYNLIRKSFRFLQYCRQFLAHKHTQTSHILTLMFSPVEKEGVRTVKDAQKHEEARYILVHVGGARSKASLDPQDCRKKNPISCFNGKNSFSLKIRRWVGLKRELSAQFPFLVKLIHFVCGDNNEITIFCDANTAFSFKLFLKKKHIQLMFTW